ncbi:PIG-L deacetylase family protein [Adhaeretor mobilis]|uniref:4-oxalmesaconate hydratase n=1 Tax=Adhaeretor mobilis TaxID=1930276 RepID=A0A517MZT2_9BACT|nr:PIG-L family deacetylase [Adhaeretor mobilis]QDS99139.1 4-oxalmesaconate hydratase [Adhaeretor mobilis]QDT00385.1 4-oxalmesaconate hydratase [Adhaeretor mobilis]
MASSTLTTRRVALAFLAHPDDAEILCAGTLLRLAKLGWETHIATATPGDCGSASLPPEEIAKIRRAEGVAAARVLGATYHCLEERDVNVVFEKETNRKAIDLFRRVAPSLVFTHPRHDYMLDHEQVHQLARSAAFGFPIPNASPLPLLAGSTIPWLYYCDPIEGSDPYSGELVKPSVRIDISEQIDRKSEMLACHASQREWLRSHHGMDEYIESMKRHSKQRGTELGTEYAEAFIQHRGHPFPQTDILHELLGGKLERWDVQ